MLKHLYLIVITLACSGCIAYNYKAENEKEHELLIAEWLHWKFSGFSDQIENGKYKVNVLLSYDDIGSLVECAIEGTYEFKKFEPEVCKSLEAIGYPTASNQTINLPINLVFQK